MVVRKIIKSHMTGDKPIAVSVFKQSFCFICLLPGAVQIDLKVEFRSVRDIEAFQDAIRFGIILYANDKSPAFFCYMSYVIV